MASLWRTAMGDTPPNPDDYDNIEYWSNPEHIGWLTKQGEYIKTWRHHWFVLKQGKLFWFREFIVTRGSKPCGVVPVATCLTLSTRSDTMYFIADSEKDKEDWINSIGRSIVQHSRCVTVNNIVDYDNNNNNNNNNNNK
ncbi:putative pleckstrin domain, PH-like domain superfamily [Helianthus annuus]|uniref:Pleckstrin domain, PH-like domain superfamily n=1 Tax=Helianthus annuus TaxID=4232 RepID=A0A251RVG7_HELAN|nr:putative pleckstrin domain, PH-like domain superfamily [Helianthus annuus]KAJ0429436.1 putative pleckstrin domain, PH-like domain superfamily [Helianthus annuus]KAJ0636574.1 putative pleckstrin domain, PH-like domain superfamily [Helianthus annuus]